MCLEQTGIGLNKLSVVIPVLDDRDNLVRLLNALSPYPDLEIIVVDSGSTITGSDLTSNASLIQTQNQGRGIQVAIGIEQSTREWIWVLHADSHIQQSNLACFDRSLEGVHWGRFDVTLLGSRWQYRIIEWLMNIRSRLTGICTGDQGMFFRRDILRSIGGFPRQPLMEDIEVSKRLRKLAKPLCSSSRLKTSTRKWETDGVIRTVLHMWGFRIRYFFGVSPDLLYKEYYQDR